MRGIVDGGGAEIRHPFRDIPFNVKKSAIAVFLNEVLYKVIREEEPNPELFSFLFNGIQLLDLKTGSLSIFHHLFLVRLSRYLGFYPRDNRSSRLKNFNLQEGEFTDVTGPENLIAAPPLSQYLHELMLINFEDLDGLVIPAASRHGLLDMLLNYYRLHLPGFVNVKSHLVLAEVFGK